MDQQTEDLWQELKLLQPIIDKIDGFTFQIKTWFITTFVAICGAAIVKEPRLLWLNFFSILCFYFLEVAYRAALAAFIQRGREVESILRLGTEPNDAVKGPNLSKYLFPKSNGRTDSTLFRCARFFGVPQQHAEEDVLATKAIFCELRNMLFQPRVSLIYLAAAIANIIVSFFLLGTPDTGRVGKLAGLFLTIGGAISLLVIPLKLTLSGTTRADWDQVFPGWRLWLTGGLLVVIGGAVLQYLF